MSSERRLGQKVISFEGARLTVPRGEAAGLAGEENVDKGRMLLDGLTYSFTKGVRFG